MFYFVKPLQYTNEKSELLLLLVVVLITAIINYPADALTKMLIVLSFKKWK